MRNRNLLRPIPAVAIKEKDANTEGGKGVVQAALKRLNKTELWELQYSDLQ